MSWPLSECYPAWLIQEAISKGFETDDDIAYYCDPKMKRVDGVLCDPRVSDEEARATIATLIPIDTRVKIEMLSQGKTEFPTEPDSGAAPTGVE